MSMIETHPFEIFVPPNAKYLILGSFAGKEAVKGTDYHDPKYDWYYGTKRNQFWPILENVYGVELRNRQAKQNLFFKLGIGIADIIYQCERGNGSNLDSNLINPIYNIKPITDVFDNYPIQNIFFTSRFVEKRFKQIFKTVISHYPSIFMITLPSPSPRFAQLSREGKIARYVELFPKL